MRRRLLIAAMAATLGVGALLVAWRPWTPADAGSATQSPPTALVTPSAHPTPTPRPAPTPTPTPTPQPTPTPPLAPGPGSPYSLALQTALETVREEAAIPGVSVAIVFPDGSTWTGVSGEADVATGDPVVPETAFALASISKTFLAALILDLAAEGHFQLDEPAGRYLPNLAIVKSVTIRQLLDHTSGLYDYFIHPRIDAALLADRDLAWPVDKTLGFVGKPYFEPGAGWHYSNTNYLVLGMLAERVDGRPLADQFRARFFEPLGLATAFDQIREAPAGPVAHGYRFAGSKLTLPPVDLADGTGIVPFRSVVTAAGGAGSLAASSTDVARWAAALYEGRAIDPASVSEMLADVERTSPSKPRVPYGLGVQVIEVDGLRTYGHSGRLLGFRSVVRYLPEQQLAIAVLTNQSRADPATIATRLIRIVVPRPDCLPCERPR